MKKLKLDLAEIQVLSFTVDSAKGGGTVNAHNPDPYTTDYNDVVNGTTTLKNTDCNSCPFCLDEPIGPAGPDGP
ncbi:MAG TPA: hypothetical protein VFS20_17295 [Longimicrobium sp.]|nr:hypothetical protein [Longimicrobium sp.]